MEQATVTAGSTLLEKVNDAVHDRVVGQNEAVTLGDLTNLTVTTGDGAGKAFADNGGDDGIAFGNIPPTDNGAACHQYTGT